MVKAPAGFYEWHIAVKQCNISQPDRFGIDLRKTSVYDQTSFLLTSTITIPQIN